MRSILLESEAGPVRADDDDDDDVAKAAHSNASARSGPYRAGSPLGTALAERARKCASSAVGEEIAGVVLGGVGDEARDRDGTGDETRSDWDADGPEGGLGVTVAEGCRVSSRSRRAAARVSCSLTSLASFLTANGDDAGFARRRVETALSKSSLLRGCSAEEGERSAGEGDLAAEAEAEEADDAGGGGRGASAARRRSAVGAAGPPTGTVAAAAGAVVVGRVYVRHEGSSLPSRAARRRGRGGTHLLLRACTRRRG